MSTIDTLVSEKDLRLSAIRGAMEKSNLDALIVLGTTGVGIPMNGNYAYVSRHVPMYASSLALLQYDGDVVLFVPGENQYLEAKAESWIDDVRLARVPVLDLCAYIETNLSPMSKIGISSFSAMPAADVATLRNKFPGVEFVDGAGIILDCRAIKSAYEQEVLRRCTEIADAGLTRSIEFLHPGVSEFEWKAEIEKVMTIAGADGGFNMISVGPPELFGGYVVSPTSKVFSDGDLALLEISPRVEGYYSQIVRLVSFGPVNPDIARAHEACVEAKKAALAVLLPGTPFTKVSKAMKNTLDQHGYTMKDIAGAHTIGLDLSELIITLNNPGVVEVGMVVTVHPMASLPGGRQLFVGDTVLIGSSGPEFLGEVRDDIIVLGERKKGDKSSGYLETWA